MISSLQSIRFLMALMIFFHHFYGIRQFGTFPVAFFFILSGFVLSIGYGDSIQVCTFNYKKFEKKRYFKIFPFNFLCLILAVFTFNSFDYFLPDILLIQSWVLDETINYSGNAVAWFLSDMFFFYLLFPFLYKWLIEKTILKTFLILICYFTVIQFIPDHLVHTYLYTSPWFRVVDFCLGITLWLIVQRYVNKGYSSMPLIGFLLEIMSFCVVILFLFLYSFFPERYGLTSLYWIPSIFLIICLTINNYSGGGGGIFQGF